jgi:hypothetical protein
MAMKHGYKAVEEYKSGVQKKFSLLETGIIQKPSTRLLLINVCEKARISREKRRVLKCEALTPKNK